MVGNAGYPTAKFILDHLTLVFDLDRDRSPKLFSGRTPGQGLCLKNHGKSEKRLGKVSSIYIVGVVSY
jgi:hypothetical protein